MPERLERGRVTKGRFASTAADGPYGCFFVRGPCGELLRIIASGADEKISEGWEHVSISTERRTPNWIEMCFVKDLFWDESECVVQFHPPRMAYVNNHPHCLHLWAKPGFPTPPSVLVGVRDPIHPTTEETDAMQAWLQ